MFGRLKSLMLGGTAGSVAAPETNIPANNTAVPGLQPEMQRMMRTKRKRDSSPVEVDSTDAQASKGSDLPTCESDDVEPPAKKAKTDNPDANILTPVSDDAFAATEDVKSGNTPSRKRRRSSTISTDDTPLKRIRRAGDDSMDWPNGDDTQAPRHGELDDPSHELRTASGLDNIIDEDALAPVNDAISSQRTDDTLGDEVDVVAGDLATGLVNIVQQYKAVISVAPHGLPSNASHTPSKRLRRQAKKYNKHVEADGIHHQAKSFDDDDEVESTYGIGSWPGSSSIPGSAQREPDDVEDRIELRRRKPHLVNWAQFVGHERPSWVKRRRAACEAQLPPSQPAE